jgi:hypothetical protein
MSGKQKTIMKLVLLALAASISSDDLWLESFPYQFNDAGKKIMDATTLKFNLLHMLRKDRTRSDVEGMRKQFGHGAMETWALLPALPFYLEHSPDLIAVALMMKCPLMFSVYLFVVVPNVQEHFQLQWMSCDLCRISLQMLYRLTKTCPGVASLLSLGRSCFFTGTHATSMGLYRLVEKATWFRSEEYYANVIVLGHNMRSFWSVVAEDGVVPIAEMAAELGHLRLWGMMKGGYCYWWPMRHLMLCAALGCGVEFVFRLTDEFLFSFQLGAGTSSVLERSKFSSSPCVLSRALQHEIRTRMALLPPLGNAVASNVEFVRRRMKLAIHRVGKSVHSICLHILLCEGNSVVKWFQMFGYGSFEDLLTIINCVSPAACGRAKRALHMRHGLGAEEHVDLSFLVEGGGTFSPKSYLVWLLKDPAFMKLAIRMLKRPLSFRVANHLRTNAVFFAAPGGRTHDLVEVLGPLLLNGLGCRLFQKMHRNFMRGDEHRMAHYGGEDDAIDFDVEDLDEEANSDDESCGSDDGEVDEDEVAVVDVASGDDDEGECGTDGEVIAGLESECDEVEEVVEVSDSATVVEDAGANELTWVEWATRKATSHREWIALDVRFLVDMAEGYVDSGHDVGDSDEEREALWASRFDSVMPKRLLRRLKQSMGKRGSSRSPGHARASERLRDSCLITADEECVKVGTYMQWARLWATMEASDNQAIPVVNGGKGWTINQMEVEMMFQHPYSHTPSDFAAFLQERDARCVRLIQNVEESGNRMLMVSKSSGMSILLEGAQVVLLFIEEARRTTLGQLLSDQYWKYLEDSGSRFVVGVVADKRSIVYNLTDEEVRRPSPIVHGKRKLTEDSAGAGAGLPLPGPPVDVTMSVPSEEEESLSVLLKGNTRWRRTEFVMRSMRCKPTRAHRTYGR